MDYQLMAIQSHLFRRLEDHLGLRSVRRDWLINLIGIPSKHFVLLVTFSKSQGEKYFLNLSNKIYFSGSKKTPYYSFEAAKLHGCFGDVSSSE